MTISLVHKCKLSARAHACIVHSDPRRARALAHAHSMKASSHCQGNCKVGHQRCINHSMAKALLILPHQRPDAYPTQ